MRKASNSVIVWSRGVQGFWPGPLTAADLLGAGTSSIEAVAQLTNGYKISERRSARLDVIQGASDPGEKGEGKKSSVS